MVQRRIQSRVLILFRLVPIGATLLLAGCGGGGGTATPGAASPKQGTIGQAQVTYFGKPKALVQINSNQVSIDTQAGASYTSFAIQPTPALDSTVLAITRDLNSQGDQIYTVPALGTGAPSILLHATASAYPSFTQGGAICFENQVGTTFSVESVLSDGTQQKVLLANTLCYPTISPNGATIAYVDTGGNIWTVPAAGGTAKEIYSGGKAIGYPVIWSPNSLQIAFTGLNPTTSTSNVYTMANTGSTPVDVTPGSIQNGVMAVSGWSPDSLSLGCTYTANGGTNSTAFLLSLSGGEDLMPTPTGFSDSSVCFSPDNLRIAFYRSNAGGATPGVYESDAAGSNPVLVVPDPPSSGSTGPVVGIAWSPFHERILYVGSGGILSSGPVAGFLLGQNGDAFASLTTFTATTPSTATIASASGNTSGGSQAFNLTADNISNISFTNSWNGSHTSISLTSTPSAVVSINGTTGLVAFVAPGKFGKKTVSPSSGASGTATYTGQFTAIYDSSGKNLAPSGATSIQVDPKSGQLISFR
jgi:hypothetical protein